jgi:hypothetical protein
LVGELNIQQYNLGSQGCVGPECPSCVTGLPDDGVPAALEQLPRQPPELGVVA